MPRAHPLRSLWPLNLPARVQRPDVRTGLVRVSAILVLAFVLGACIQAEPRSPPVPSGTITVGSFDFPESVVLAELYAEVLRRHDYPVRLLANIGAREVVGPALGRGLVDLVPEYAGSALGFFDLGARPTAHDAVATHVALVHALASRGLVPLAAAPAQDANAIVVTEATARRFHLSTIGDLAPVASQLVFGGPPECPERPLCLVGLRSLYGLSFHAFVGLDTDGPLTLEALLGGDVDVAELNTTMPSIQSDHLVVLEDNLRLQPSENITPVVRGAVLTRYGSAFADVVNSVSAQLTSAELTRLDAEVMRTPQALRAVARRWLTSHGLR